MDCIQRQLPLQGPLSQDEEWRLVSLCKGCANPPLSLVSHMRALCSPSLYMPNCASFLRKWVIAITCNNVDTVRIGVNNDADPDSRALQPIYNWKLFALLGPKSIFGTSLLLCGHNPTTSELCSLDAMATDPDIGDERMELVCAYLCAEGTKAESVSILSPIFQKGASDEDKAKALNALMRMYIKGGIMLDELCEYAKILDPKNQYTHTIIALLLGLHSGASMGATGTFGEMRDSMIEHITAHATTKGAFGTTPTLIPTRADIEGMILALYIGTVLTPTTPTTPTTMTTPTSPTSPTTPTTPTTPTDEKQLITTKRVIIMAIECGYNDIVTVMKVAHDRAIRADAELFWHVLTSRTREY